MKKKILITGGTGFLAKNLVKHLDHNKFNITLLTRNIEKLKYLKNEFNVDLEEINWNDIKDVQKKLFGYDCIVHTASIVPTRSDANNFKIIKSSINICKKICNVDLNLKKFIFISTLRTCINTSETEFIDDTKYDFFKYDTAYGKSKYLSEKYLIKHKNKHNLPLIICSPAHILGPESEKISKGNEFIFNIFKKKINFYINTKYAIVDIFDVCEAIKLIIEKSDINEKYLICDNNPTILEIISFSEKLQGSKIKIFLPMFLINFVSLFFEFVNKFFKLNNLPINRSSYHFANLNGKFKGDKIKKIGLKYTNFDQTINKLYKYYNKN